MYSAALSNGWPAETQGFVKFVQIVNGVAFLSCRVNVLVKRCGGAFGGKLTRAAQIAAAAGVAANAAKRLVPLSSLSVQFSLLSRY